MDQLEITSVSRVAKGSELGELKKLSTEKLLIWVIGRTEELRLKLSVEELVLECWYINPEKHSMRGYPQFPDSHTVQRRVADMKGKKGLLSGLGTSGYGLTEISRRIYADLTQLVQQRRVNKKTGGRVADREISSMEEAPYKRLKNTPAYEKYKLNRLEQIVETDFLYFYALNWHSKKNLAHNRIKNVDSVVEVFSKKDPILKEVHKLLNKKFAHIRKRLLQE